MLALAAALMATPRPSAAEQAASGRPGASSERPERAGAVAAGEPVIALSSGLVLHAGERLEIRWSVSETSVDELEILLSIDGGRSFPLRVSPELDARAGRYVWRVPKLSSADARMRLRYHRDGREIDGASSAPFTLIASEGAEGPGSPAPEPGSSARAGNRDCTRAGNGECVRVDRADREAGRERPLVHEGTWWSGLGAIDLPLAAEAFASPGDRIAASRELPAAGPAPATPSPPRRAAAVMTRPCISAPARATCAPLTPERQYPLRN